MKPALSLVPPLQQRRIPLSLYGRNFEVYEAANIGHVVAITEVNEHRALTFGAIQLGVSAEKARVRRAPSVRP
jgi:hypothetical protein